MMREDRVGVRGRGRASVAAAALALALGFGPAGAGAEPLLKPGAKPGLVTRWSEKKGTVTLELSAGVDAAAVVSAIGGRVAGAKAEVSKGKVVVRGLPMARLLAALEGVELEAPAADEDVDAMLTELRGAGSQDEGSGSSIRATKAVDFADVFEDEGQALTAKVLDVERRQFPLVKVRLQITGTSPATPALKKGARVTILPRIKLRDGVLDPEDRLSRLNVGAWYAQPGDVVRVRLEGEPRDDVWIAEAFERKRPGKGR